MSKSVKRFVLFICEVYYPGGGWSDYAGSFDTYEEALKVWQDTNQKYKWFEIVDLLEAG